MNKYKFPENPTKPLLRSIMCMGPMKDFIIKHKAIFMEAIIAYADILPETTRENSILLTTHRLIDKRDEFFSKSRDYASRREMLEAVWKIVINENEHDQFYGDILNEIVDIKPKGEAEGRIGV